MLCVLCQNDTWTALPDPQAGQGVTTAGLVVPQALSKMQCGRCGLVQRKEGSFLGLTEFYEKRYQQYYERPGSPIYDRRRYEVMAEWMGRALGDFEPRAVLDIGCGAGWSMKATQELYPTAEIEGVEPSEINSGIARDAGFVVYQTRVGDEQYADESAFERKYDLIYSQNVLMHVVDPVRFLIASAELLTDGGVIVAICPDATVASNELLWCDHNYSFHPKNMIDLARVCGLELKVWQTNPQETTILDKQIAVFSKPGSSRSSVGNITLPEYDLGRVYYERCDYLNSWRNLDRYLTSQVRQADRVFNFGASTWTWLLAGYCPDYWAAVTSCTVDGFDGRCVDKDVEAFSALRLSETDAVVLGVNPASQEGFRKRFATEAFKTVGWDHLIQR